VIHLIQGSQEWLDFRKTRVGASDAVIIAGMSPWRSRAQLLDEKRGLIEPQPMNSSMQRGTRLEPIARALAEDMFDTLFVAEVRVSKEYEWCYASLDGICIDNKILLEIKCTSKKNHALAKDGKIPDYYKPQLQHQMYVCGFDKCHYFSFATAEIDYEGPAGVVVVEHRDDAYIKNLIELEKKFYEEMTSGKCNL
jgi:putative phage-type endonuclease